MIYAIMLVLAIFVGRMLIYIIEDDTEIERVKSKESVYLSEEQIQKLEKKEELPVVDTNCAKAEDCYQEVNAGKVFYKCHVGVVMTNSIFTKSAIELAEATNVLLWDRVFVQRMMSNGMVLQQNCESKEIQKLQSCQISKQYQYLKETNIKQVSTQKASVKKDFEDDDDYEGSDAEEIATKKLCSKLKKNLIIDMEIWNKLQLDFKCNLVPEYTSWHLNFEIKNKSGIRWNKTEGGITIKANVYNARGKLLAVEDVFISDDALKRNRYSDYIFLDFIKNADRIDVYAYRED